MNFTSFLRFSFFYFIFSVHPVSHDSYDYLKLVVQWQPSVCSQVGVTCHGSPSPEFTIHGLWPSIYDKPDKQPRKCTMDRLNVLALPGDLKKEMRKYWPNVKSPDKAKEFWEEEWSSHGTCQDMEPEKYLKFAVDTIKKPEFDLLTSLNVEGVIPNNQYCDSRAVKKAISKHTKKWPGLRCVHKAVRGNPSQLNEVVLCFDKTETLIDCQDYYDSNCKGPILFTS